ncbi:RagB/SusD family nutrient uptake outer membrane protein [Mucilaginibacter sp. UR6-11]|uniref:RagB/SusD family nutrient uptake outer membrane protein n=1 Tax=Mucilaginibacter sp. UR6-11 TaxID=1435644 RepID=UPI001E2D0331|nr:RagB/SusD family nutrient uptake outer membrane protein [Mucilaginibacter sp. UR6-11]MCC8426470.1 RagB/SusD family nutrient uptake outer membrane protein [Mucilaginibacter sp. UR6-11]
MKIMKTKLLIILCLFALAETSCKKDWLDAKTNKNLVVPVSITDMQALLDNSGTFIYGSQPTLGEQGSDDYYLSDALLNSSYADDHNAYLWAKLIFSSDDSADWDRLYQQVYYANTALDGLEAIKPDAATQANWNVVKGEGLFDRAWAFSNIAGIFAPPYSIANAAKPGVILRLSSDINIKTGRSTVQQTYDQITTDLLTAARLLPVTQQVQTHIRPDRVAAYALLSRVYLGMQQFGKAKLYADSCLQLNSALMNFNTLNPASSRPIPMTNVEIIYFASCALVQAVRFSNPDPGLYASYQPNDLRKTILYNSTPANITFKGSYTQSILLFGGLATDEVYLTRAECEARAGDKDAAMADLNTLLVTRFKTGTFVPLTAVSADDALGKVLAERRKELAYRTTRWMDLRRLNLEPRFAVTLQRVANGQTYTLPPNDDRYTYPLPQNELLYNDVQQNPR